MPATAYNIHEAKTQFSRLVDRAMTGEEIVIAKAGTPVVKLVPITPVVIDTSKRIGFLKGQFTVPDDFDTMFQDEIIAMFEGAYEGKD